MEKKHLELLMSVILVLCACVLAEKGWAQVSVNRAETGKDKKTVIVDAGHGGSKRGWTP